VRCIRKNTTRLGACPDYACPEQIGVFGNYSGGINDWMDTRPETATRFSATYGCQTALAGRVLPGLHMNVPNNGKTADLSKAKPNASYNALANIFCLRSLTLKRLGSLSKDTDSRYFDDTLIVEVERFKGKGRLTSRKPDTVSYRIERVWPLCLKRNAVN